MKNMRRVVLAAACVMLASGGFESAAAVDDMPELRLSLRDAIEAAVDNNPTVRLLKERVMEARGSSQDELGALLPNVSGQLSWNRRTFFLGSLGVSGGVTGPFNFFDYRGMLTQNLFSLSLIQKWRAARTGIEVAELDAEVTRRDAMAMAGLLYVEALRAEAAVEAVEANIKLNKELLRLAQDRKAAGLATGLDVTRELVQLENEKQRLLVAQNEQERAKLNLIRALGIDFRVKLVLTDELKLVELPGQTTREALQVARANRTELKAQNRRERLAALSLSSVSSERVPSFSFNGDWGHTGSKIDGTLETWSTTLMMTIPVFDGGSREGRISRERSLVRQEQIRAKDVAHQITLEVRDALLTLQSTQQQVVVAREGLRLSLRELDLARERFTVGVANNVEVTNAQASVARARDNVVEALSNFNASRINVARATGRIELLY